VKPVTAQPVEQNIAQVTLPSLPVPVHVTTSKELSLPTTKSEISVPSATPGEESIPTGPTPQGKPHLGRATAQIWIGSPPVDDIHSMFPPEHREKIREVTVHKPTDPNSKYALVYFHSVEDASAAIETLDHPKVKFGTEYVRSQGRGGSFSSRGSYSQGSYDARKSLSESDRGFGRGGRGGRGGMRGAPSSGSYSRGTSSPGPSRGTMRGRGGSSYSRDVSGDKQEWQDRPETKEASWPSEEKPPMPPTAQDPTPTTTAAGSMTGGSTVGESQQSS
jgi:hypothetical protein